MYRAFNLSITLDQLAEADELDELISIGKQRRRDLEEFSETELKNYVLADGTVDGSGLSARWFREISSDIFISHSHNDEELTFALAGWLKKTFDLNVFVDEVVWGSADRLLRALDDEHCWQEASHTYNYRQRNLTTSHVHAMLSTAIYSVMDQSEAVFFLNTEESAPRIADVMEEDSAYTLSPWIYEEVTATKLLRVRELSDYREERLLEHVQGGTGEKGIKIAYKIPMNQLVPLNQRVLRLWEERYQSRRTTTVRQGTIDHPLDDLYLLLSMMHGRGWRIS